MNRLNLTWISRFAMTPIPLSSRRIGSIPFNFTPFFVAHATRSSSVSSIIPLSSVL